MADVAGNPRLEIEETADDADKSRLSTKIAWLDLRSASRCVPHTRNLDGLLLVIDAIDDAIWLNMISRIVRLRCSGTLRPISGCSCSMSVCAISRYANDSAFCGLSREMKRTMSRKSSRETGDQINL